MKKLIKIFLTTIMFVSVFYFTTQTFCCAKSERPVKSLTSYTKEPVSKRKIAYKFILAMLGVGASSVVIFVGLTIYNKIIAGGQRSVSSNKSKSSNKLNEVIQLFVDKTNWD